MLVVPTFTETFLNVLPEAFLDPHTSFCNLFSAHQTHTTTTNNTTTATTHTTQLNSNLHGDRDREREDREREREEKTEEERQDKRKEDKTTQVGKRRWKRPDQTRQKLEDNRREDQEKRREKTKEKMREIKRKWREIEMKRCFFCFWKMFDNPQTRQMNLLTMYRRKKNPFWTNYFLICPWKVQNITVFSILYMTRIRFSRPRELFLKEFRTAH